MEWGHHSHPSCFGLTLKKRGTVACVPHSQSGNAFTGLGVITLSIVVFENPFRMPGML